MEHHRYRNLPVHLIEQDKVTIAENFFPPLGLLSIKLLGCPSTCHSTGILEGSVFADQKSIPAGSVKPSECVTVHH